MFFSLIIKRSFSEWKQSRFCSTSSSLTFSWQKQTVIRLKPEDFFPHGTWNIFFFYYYYHQTTKTCQKVQKNSDFWRFLFQTWTLFFQDLKTWRLNDFNTQRKTLSSWTFKVWMCVCAVKLYGTPGLLGGGGGVLGFRTFQLRKRRSSDRPGETSWRWSLKTSVSF